MNTKYIYIICALIHWFWPQSWSKKFLLVLFIPLSHVWQWNKRGNTLWFAYLKGRGSEYRDGAKNVLE